MIAYLKGQILKKEEDRLLILVNQIGYEVVVPYITMEVLEQKKVGEEVALYIYYCQTERQPRPILIGFICEEEKAFFQLFISVDAIGPLKAIKALTIPIRKVANAIEAEDVNLLKNLKGIGLRTAQKIVASLKGKMGVFVDISSEKVIHVSSTSISKPVMNVLVNQLGYSFTEARQMISDAMSRDKSIETSEQLLDKVFRKDENL